MEAFQEESKYLHSLLEVLSDSKLRVRGLARGREGSEWERSTILSDFRRELILAGAKSYSSCLLGRIARVGEEHRNAARRRVWVMREDERRAVPSRVYWLANVRRRGIFRGRGNFVTNLG